MKKSTIAASAVFLGVIAVLLSFTVSSAEAASVKKGGTPVVSEGKSVKVNYTLTVDGKVVDSSSGRGPLEFKAGSHQMIPGFEKAVMGMKAGEKKSFKVSPKEGYGIEDPKAIRDIPKNQLPPEVTPKVGMTLTAHANGQQVPVRIVEIKKDTVVMNFNHPLAGKTLHFNVEVLEIK